MNFYKIKIVPSKNQTKNTIFGMVLTVLPKELFCLPLTMAWFERPKPSTLFYPGLLTLKILFIRGEIK
jgi:hypothetical protein